MVREGWTISHDPYVFDSDPKLATDLAAERLLAAERELEKIEVEVKSFVTQSQVVDLERAIGQYGLYRRLLRIQDPDRQLYLAVPQFAYEDIFSRQVGQIAIQEFAIQMLVFTPEEQLKWI